MLSLLSCVFTAQLFHIYQSQTIIATEWTDDFTGWSNTKSFNQNCGPTNKYHGVYEINGNTILEQSFTCDNGITNQRYSVSVTYGIAYDPCGDKNTVYVKIDSQTEATHKRLDGTSPANYNTGTCFSPNIGCQDATGTWIATIQKDRSITPNTLNDITSNDPFTLTFDITSNSAGFELAIFGIVVTCNAKTFSPSYIPTTYPTFHPTVYPTIYPTNIPTTLPTSIPTGGPTTEPTIEPTIQPTTYPTYIPTYIPTNIPTYIPTSQPSIDPTNA
eukprot:79630_1